jgi:hypothetical protein
MHSRVVGVVLLSLNERHFGRGLNEQASEQLMGWMNFGWNCQTHGISRRYQKLYYTSPKGSVAVSTATHQTHGNGQHTQTPLFAPFRRKVAANAPPRKGPPCTSPSASLCFVHLTTTMRLLLPALALSVEHAAVSTTHTLPVDIRWSPLSRRGAVIARR